MKVFFCPNCRISPDITTGEVKCPKCGKTSVGKDLTETVTNWNNGVFTTETKVKMVAEEVKTEDAVKEPKERRRRKRSE